MLGWNLLKGYDQGRAMRSNIPVLTWKSYKRNARTGPTYRAICFITRRTCRVIFGEREKELLY